MGAEILRIAHTQLMHLSLGSRLDPLVLGPLFLENLGPGRSRLTPLTSFGWARPVGLKRVTCTEWQCWSDPGPLCPRRRLSRLTVPPRNCSCVECVACSAVADIRDRGSLLTAA